MYVLVMRGKTGISRTTLPPYYKVLVMLGKVDY